MKLYFSRGACSLAVRIILNELGLNCEYVSVDIKAKKLENGQDYYSINPKGAVPVLLTDQGEILTENSVILQYLADLTPNSKLLPLVGDFNRYRALEWLNFVSTELHKGFAPLFNPQIDTNLKEQIFIPGLQKKFQWINRALEGKSYLMGDTFTLPDSYLFVMLLWAEKMKINLSEYKHLMKYYQGLQKRKAIQKSLTEESLKITA